MDGWKSAVGCFFAGSPPAISWRFTPRLRGVMGAAGRFCAQIALGALLALVASTLALAADRPLASGAAAAAGPVGGTAGPGGAGESGGAGEPGGAAGPQPAALSDGERAELLAMALAAAGARLAEARAELAGLLDAAGPDDVARAARARREAGRRAAELEAGITGWVAERAGGSGWVVELPGGAWRPADGASRGS